MKNERKGIDKKEIIKNAKKNDEMNKFIESLTEEDMELVKNRHHFGMAEPGTISYQVALYNDAIRSQIRSIKSQIENSLWTIDNLNGSIKDCKLQLETGEIKMQNKDGTLMQHYEMRSYIWKQDLLLHGEISALPLKLGQLRSNVGYKDVAMNIVMTEEEFDVYVNKIKEGVEKYGYKLFEEVF